MAGLMEGGARVESLRYVSFPLRDDGPRALALPAIIACVSVAVGVSLESAPWALAAAGLLTAMVARYFAPTRYTLDAQGVRARFLGRERRRAWSEVRALYRHRDGVHLSPFPRPSRLDPFRGIYVRFAGNREEVLRFCERHVACPPA
jgi:hypothetical protein